jgi:RimJ/RimL family protein N-acetyltransferase
MTILEQPVLETERLILRPFIPDDASRISRLAGEKAISDTTLRIPHPYSEEDAFEWILTHQSIREKGLALFYAIELKDDPDSGLIGSTGLDIDSAHLRAEIGYWIGREYWNRGYATEAASILVGFAFEGLKLHKVSSHHFARNEASGRVLEKLGLKQEGLLRSHILKSGEWEDIIEYGLLESEYSRPEAGLQRSG